MHHLYTNATWIRGQSLLEMLFALSLAIMTITTIGYLFLNTQASAQAVKEHTRATELAKEGIAAVQAMAQHDPGDLAAGTHGLAFSGGGWTLAGSVENIDSYMRTVSLSALDASTYEVVSTVTWSIFGGRSGTVAFTSRVANWRQNAGAAAVIAVDTASLDYNASGTAVSGIDLTNTGVDSVTVTAMNIYWNGTAGLTGVTIGGVSVFSASSSDPAVSGEIIDSDDHALALGTTAFALQFTDDMRATDVLVALRLQDESIRYFRLTP